MNKLDYDKKSRVQVLKEKKKINSEIILSIYPFNFLNEKIKRLCLYQVNL